MNWTEGNLARHSRGRQRNQLLAKQRQHFDKARSSVLNGGVKQGPLTISFLGDELVVDRRPRDKISSVLHSSPLQLQREHSHRRLRERSLSKLEPVSRLSDRAHGSTTEHNTKQVYSDEVRPPQGVKRSLGSHDPDENSGQPSRLHEKRQKLLNRADWVGISIQQPLNISFPGQKNRHDDRRWSKAVDNQTRGSNSLRC